MNDEVKKEGLQTPDETKPAELSDQELEKAAGGKLHEAACKGTHLPEVVIELW